MHLHFEKNINAKCDCPILSLSWMGKVPDELGEGSETPYKKRRDGDEDADYKLNRTNYYQEGWLATGNVRGVVGVTFTTSHCRGGAETPLRTNYNLRGHRSEVILVKWNEPYQKLASCDSSGVIFVWIKYEGRWSIELINDRSTPVTHFSWSHDGRMALICYQDGFVLVGSVAGQRYWSSMLTLTARITCGCWTPDDAHVYLGTATAQLVVMDVHGAMVSQVQLNSESDGGIMAMAWSCEKFKMDEEESEGSTSDRNFGPHVLAVAFGGGGVVLLRGHDDVSPVRIRTGLDGATLAMEWDNSRELLAIAGSLPSEEIEGTKVPPYKNLVKFYNDGGILLYTVVIPYTQSPVSALTWGHAGVRLFVATGAAVHVARVWRRVAPLQLLARVCAAAALPAAAAAELLPLPPPLLPLVAGLFAHTIRCCIPEPSAMREFVSRPPPPPQRLHCTMLRHEDDDAGGGAGFTLYLEHLGGLVPLLKGRRTSKIRPEFVIFDPQGEDLNVLHTMNNEPATGSSSSSGSGSGSGSSSGSSSANSGGRGSNGRPPTPHTYTSPSDSSDTEREEGCSGSPRLQRKRRARRRGRGRARLRTASEKAAAATATGASAAHERFCYIDSLPEDVRLVEVTSNIWGTKFKMHGLAKNVPSNLGQVTYKTSLLHLQPRQMTLVITELHDDCPVDPDPNFNPNIFSEDEEDVFQAADKPSSSPVHYPNLNRNYTFASEKLKSLNTAATNPQPSDASLRQSSPNNNNVLPALARAESYEDEFPYIDINEMVNYCEQINNNLNRQIAQAISAPAPERRVSSTSVSNRHAISPLRCDGSVPTLQSPKNAVAPTDIIFERPAPQTARAARGDFCSVRSDPQQLKTNLIALEQPVFNLNLVIEPKRQASHIHEISKVRKNIPKAETHYDVPKFQKPVTTRNVEVEHHYEHISNNRSESVKNTRRIDDFKFIDEETLVDNLSALTEKRETSKVQRTTTVVPISPMCSTVPVYDNMIRSCSLGFLDLVDPPSAHLDVTLATLRRDEPKRLILVNKKHKHNMHKSSGRKHCNNTNRNELSNTLGNDNKSPNLQKCGKSKSLDSSELPLVTDKRLINLSKIPSSIEETKAINNINSLCNTLKDTSLSCSVAVTEPLHRTNKLLPKEPPKLSFFTSSKTPQPHRRSRRDLPVCDICKCVNPNECDAPVTACAGPHVCAACRTARPACCPVPPPLTPAAVNTANDYLDKMRFMDRAKGADTDGEGERLSSLEQLLVRLRRDTPGSASARSAPSSPRLPRAAADLAASPQPRPKRAKRNSSASPIRQILNSPLLNRRRYKKQSESSDDEQSNLGSERLADIVNGRNFKDLESFQKSQLRQKLKRGKLEVPNSYVPSLARRQLVMHNKAPMWNENSQVYQLDFGGRVTQESAKNFQIEYHGKQVMQFGRIDGNAYTLDFQYPFSALQAFAVALANVTQRLK